MILFKLKFKIAADTCTRSVQEWAVDRETQMPHPFLMNCLLLIESLPSLGTQWWYHQAPVDNPNPAVTQMTLVKLNGTQNQTRSHKYRKGSGREEWSWGGWENWRENASFVWSCQRTNLTMWNVCVCVYKAFQVSKFKIPKILSQGIPIKENLNLFWLVIRKPRSDVAKLTNSLLHSPVIPHGHE